MIILYYFQYFKLFIWLVLIITGFYYANQIYSINRNIYISGDKHFGIDTYVAIFPFLFTKDLSDRYYNIRKNFIKPV